MTTEMPRKDVPPPFELVKERITEVLPPEVEERIRSGELKVVDVRDPDKFAAGHIEGAVNITAGENAAGAREESYAESVAEAIGGRDGEAVLYCSSGNKSARTADALTNEHGFKGVTSLVGGVTLWRDLGYPVAGDVANEEEDS